MKMADIEIPVFHPDNHAELVALMDKYGSTPNFFVGENESGEQVIVGIHPERITIVTSQKNGWERMNVYWRDGFVDELYHKDKDGEKPTLKPHTAPKTDLRPGNHFHKKPRNGRK